MANKKLSVQDFAAKIKAKYPQYKNVNDTELTGKVLQKYPTYSQSVNYNPQQDQVTDPLAGPLRSLGLGAVSDMANAGPLGAVLGPGGSAMKQMQTNPAQGLGDLAGLGAWASGAGEEMAGAKVASTIPGLVGKVLGNAVPRFASGALQGASQPGANPTSIAESGGINTALGPIGNTLGKLQSTISLGKEGPALQDIAKTTGKPVVGGYKKIAQQMGQMQEALQGKINNIYDRSGGLSRKDMQDTINYVFNQPGNQWLKVNKGVQDWIKNTLTPIIKEAGDNHFLDKMSKGEAPNHIVPPEGAGVPAQPGEATTMGGQGTKGPFPQGTRKVVRPNAPGANRVGPSTTFTSGSFKNEKGQFAEKGNPQINQPGSVRTDATHAVPDPIGSWVNSPVFQQSQETAQAWGDQATQIPLHVWDSVVKNIGEESKGAFKAASAGAQGAATAEQRFGSKLYHALQQKMATRMAPEDAVDYMKTKALKNKAYVIQKHADLTSSGKINPLKKAAIAGGGIEGANMLAHGALNSLIGPGIGAAGVAYGLTRPAVTTAMQSPMGKNIINSVGRLGGSGISGFFNNQNQ